MIQELSLYSPTLAGKGAMFVAWKGAKVKRHQPQLNLTKSIFVSSLFYHTRPVTFMGFG